MGAVDLTSVTFGLAIATTALAAVAVWQLLITRRASLLAVRPLLVDATPLSEPVPQERVLFGAPGRTSPFVDVGALYYDDEAGFHLSMPFENIGAGAAAIQGARLEPNYDADISVNRLFVAPGATVRVNVAILPDLEGNARFRDQWWAMATLSVVIEYTDAAGKQRMVSHAHLNQAAVRGPWVGEVRVCRRALRGRWKVVATGTDRLLKG